MKIEIDTQRDSKEELKKLAKFLHELGDGVIPTNQGSGIFDNNSNSSNDTGNLLGLFGDDNKTSNNTSTPLNSMLETVQDDVEEKKDDKEETPELEFY